MEEGGTSEGGMSEGGASEGGSTEGGSSEGGGTPEASTCGTTPTACVNPSTGANDFCTSATSTCGACTDVTDDPNCQTAYGSTYICVGGACVVGNCHNSSNCTTAGQICGASTPNTCGTCSGDPQCQADPSYGSAFVCSNAGLCVSSACTGVNAACTTNTADFCCPTALLSTTYVCVSGTCCTDDTSICGTGMTCQGSTGNQGGTCTTCAAATGNVYYVNPATGSDSGHTGSTSCPFKTLTKAFEFLGTTATTGTVVELEAADPATNGEAFPLIVPAGVTVTGAFTVSITNGKVGFILDAANSGLNGPTLDGGLTTTGATPGLTGIAAFGGSSAVTTQVQNVTVQNFAGPGIVVGKSNNKATTAGAVTLGPGLIVAANGTTTKNEPGVVISAGSATVTGTAGAGTGHTSIHGNTQHGILVDGTGSVSINPTSTTAAGAAGVAYVDLDGNNVAGLWISQTVGNTAPATNTVNFVEATGTVTGNGIHVNGGSSLVLRGSFVVGNKASGVFIGSNGTGAANNNIALIDLGDVASDGQNTLQGPIGTNPVLTNELAGVCVNITAPTGTATGQTLNAVGNLWGVANSSTQISCEKTGAGGKLTHATGCADAIDVGGIGTTTAGANTANVATCTYE